MAQVRIHNITDRPNVDRKPYAVKIKGQPIRPGKHLSVDSSLISPTFRKLHGSAVWIGDKVPAKYRATSRSALRSISTNAVAMTIEESREYLSSLDKEELLSLCTHLSPILTFSKTPSTRLLVVKLSRALFSGNRIVSPEEFFWLRRWRRSGSSFIEQE